MVLSSLGSLLSAVASCDSSGIVPFFSIVYVVPAFFLPLAPMLAAVLGAYLLLRKSDISPGFRGLFDLAMIVLVLIFALLVLYFSSQLYEIQFVKYYLCNGELLPRGDRQRWR